MGARHLLHHAGIWSYVENIINGAICVGGIVGRPISALRLTDLKHERQSGLFQPSSKRVRPLTFLVGEEV
jgi:hypothetical protein